MLQVENMSVREQILVVDDKPMICKSCKEILEDEGFFVDMAYFGEEGLKEGLENRFPEHASSILFEVKPPTGEAYAGDSPVRFGGWGERNQSVLPTPIVFSRPPGLRLSPE